MNKYPTPFGKPHHFNNEVDFRYLSTEQQEQALADGWSPPMAFLSASGLYGDYGQTYSVLPTNCVGYSSQFCLTNTAHDGLANSQIWNGN